MNDDISDQEIGAVFVEENNDYTTESVSFTSMILHWMHQWRLAALFMISGMGTAFAFKSRTWKLFLKERCQRLLIPMFFGAWTMGFIGTSALALPKQSSIIQMPIWDLRRRFNPLPLADKRTRTIKN